MQVPAAAAAATPAAAPPKVFPTSRWYQLSRQQQQQQQAAQPQGGPAYHLQQQVLQQQGHYVAYHHHHQQQQPGQHLPQQHGGHGVPAGAAALAAGQFLTAQQQQLGCIEAALAALHVAMHAVAHDSYRDLQRSQLVQRLGQVQAPPAAAQLLQCFKDSPPPPMTWDITNMCGVGPWTPRFWWRLLQNPRLRTWATTVHMQLHFHVQDQLPHLQQPPPAGTVWTHYLLDGMAAVSKTLPALGRTCLGSFLQQLVGLVPAASPSGAPPLSNLAAAMAARWPHADRLAQPELLQAVAQVSLQRELRTQ